MNIRRIVPDLHADDPSAAAAFYAAVFGLQVVMDQGWIVTVADLDHGDRQLSFLTADATAPELPAVSIEVADVDAAYRAALEAGAEIVHPISDEEWGVRRFFLRDPAGHVVNVVSHQQ